MKKLILIFLFVFSAFAGQKTWTASDSATNTNWNNANNWSPPGVPGTTDTVTFDANGGSKSPTVNISPSIAKLITTSAYTRALSFSGMTLTLNSGGAVFRSTGALNTGNELIFSGSDDSLYISSGLGTLTYTSTAITQNGNLKYVIEKLYIPKSYTKAAKKTVTFSGSAGIYFSGSGTLFTTGDSGRTTISTSFFLIKTGNGDFYSIGNGDTVDGTGNINFQNDASVSTNLPKFNYTGSGAFGLSLDANAAVTSSMAMTGDFTALNAANALQIQITKASTCTFNFNNYNMSIGGTLRPGCRNASGNLQIKYGSGIIKCNSVNWAFGQLGTTTDSMQSCKIITTSNVNAATSGHTFVPGTSKIIIANTCTFTSSGFTFYDVVDSIGALTFADSATILNDFTILSGNSSATTWSGYGMYVGGDFNHDGTGTCNTGNSINFPNASSLFHIGASTGALTSSNTNIYPSGASLTTDIDKYVRFKNAVFTDKSDHTIGGSFDSLRLNKITLSDSVGIKVQATKKLVIDSLGDIEGSAGKLCRVQSTSAGSAFTLTMPTDSVDYVYFKDVTATNTIYARTGCVDGGGNTNIVFQPSDTIPIITAITPTSSPTAGGDSATITLSAAGGQNLDTVFFGTTASVMINGYKVKIPAHTHGIVSIIVANSAGRDTLPNAFTYIGTPVIDSIRPTHGTIGTIDTIKGTVFGVSPSLFINSLSNPVATTSTDSTTIIFAAPAGYSGNVNFIVKNNTYTTYDTVAWSYDTVVTIDSIRPYMPSILMAAQKTGATFKVRGRGFRATKGTGTIKLGTSNLLTTQVWSDTLIIDTIPASWTPKGTYNIIVESSYGYKDTSRIRVLIPTITPMNP